MESSATTKSDIQPNNKQDIACGLNRTSMIARHEGKSSSNISSRLKRLRDKVYLARSFVLSETGGDEYVYRCIYKL